MKAFRGLLAGRIVPGAAMVGAVMLLSGLWGGEAQAAGFDCKKAASRIERLICGDPELNSFDSQLDGAYRGALDRSNQPASVKDRQLAWLKQRDACADVACLSAAYQRQIKVLGAVSDEPPICQRAASTLDVNACGAEYSRRADRELDRYLATARKNLAEELSGEFADPAAKSALAEFNAAQKTWEAFRKAECSATYSRYMGGTIRGSMYEGCWREVTEARTHQVWLNWLQFMDRTPPLMPEPSPR